MDELHDTPTAVGTSFMRGFVDFDTDDMGAGGPEGGGAAVVDPPAAPAVDTTVFADPDPEPDPNAAPTLDPTQIAELVRSNQELGELFRSTVAQRPPAAAIQPPAAQVTPEPAAQPTRLETALANYDAFNPQSVKDLLTAQAEDMREQFQRDLSAMRGEYAPIVNEHINAQGEQLAKAELTGFEGHIGFGFDHDDAISAARNLLAQNPEMSERDALWYGANQVAQKERTIGMRYVQAYRDHVNTLANAGEGEPTVPAANGELDLSDDRYTGSGKYGRLVRDRMAADRARQPATV